MLDEKLLAVVEKAVKGDEEAFEELCSRKGRDILYIAMRLMDSPQEAEDAAQEVMVYMYKNITRLKAPGAFNVWLYRIVRSTCSDMRRRGKSRATLPQEGAENAMEDRKEFLPYDFYEDRAKREKLMEVVKKLPEKCKVCVLLFYYENMSYKEIAKTMHISKKEVDHTLMKSKKLIRRALEKEAWTKKFLSKMYLVSSITVLSKVLHADAGEAVTAQALERIDKGWKSTVAGTTLLSYGRRGGNISGVVAKVTLGVVITAGVTAAAMGYIGKKDSEELQNAEANHSQKQEQNNMFGSEVKKTEKIIKTLSDMIGTDEAAELEEYANVTIHTIRALEQFYERIGLEVVENSYRIAGEEKYTLYILDKQQKRLMVIVKEDVTSGSCSISYRFTDINEQVPTDAGIYLSYEAWE